MNDPVKILAIIDEKIKEAAKLVQECKDLAEGNGLVFELPDDFGFYRLLSWKWLAIFRFFLVKHANTYR